jgi:uncharacterized protein YacL
MRQIVLAVAGLTAGVSLALGATSLLARLWPGVVPHTREVFFFLALFLAYGGFSVGLVKGRTEGILPIGAAPSEAAAVGGIPKILDTSAIIDGRILKVCRTGFVDSQIVVPRFVLRELQAIADSTNPAKRAKGRRGLDVLNELSETDSIVVRIVEYDYPEIPEVDGKLVKLAKEIGGKVVTNDYNLNRVAEFQNVSVLNVNELVEALQLEVLPGNHLNVRLVKPGNEPNQAIGYLEDGTMVVVNEAGRKMRTDVSVVVTNVQQTKAGRMVFARIEGK